MSFENYVNFKLVCCREIVEKKFVRFVYGGFRFELFKFKDVWGDVFNVLGYVVVENEVFVMFLCCWCISCVLFFLVSFDG